MKNTVNMYFFYYSVGFKPAILLYVVKKYNFVVEIVFKQCYCIYVAKILLICKKEVKQMQLQIDSIDLKEPAFAPIVSEIAKAIEEAKELAKTRAELPRYMNKQQAAKYLNVSYNSMVDNYIRKHGLKVIIVEGVQRIDKRDCDELMERLKQ